MIISDEASARDFVKDRVSEAAFVKICDYIQLLTAENDEQNLVSKSSLDHVWQRHIADSVQLLDYVSRGTSPWLDLGSGAGLPGIIIAIAREADRVVLVESRRKRIEWLERCVSILELQNCTIEGRRLELLSTLAAGAITARAFAPTSKLLNLASRFATPKTIWVLPKGQMGQKDYEALPKRVRQMFHVEQSLTGEGAQILVGRGSLGK